MDHSQIQTPRTLPFTTYMAPPVRSQPNNTTKIQSVKPSFRSAAPAAVKIPCNSDVDIDDTDGPTPRASSRKSPVHRRPPSTSSFDSLYDVSSSSDDEHIDAFFLQLRVSDSVKHSASSRRAKLEINIPEAEDWPTIQKLKKSLASGEVSPSKRLPLSPAALAKLAGANLRPPRKTNTPSLVESSTTDEHSSTCPSTPELHQSAHTDEGFQMPLQLNPVALDTLQNLSPDLASFEDDQALQASTAPQNEMQDLGLDLAAVISSPEFDDLTTPISALSVPSPGGFFSSLNDSTRKSWYPSPSPISPPTSAVAERFYFGTENKSLDTVMEQVIEIQESADSDGPPTARKMEFSRVTSMESSSVNEIALKENVYDYDETYASKLLDNASTNMNRTSLWLSAQASYMTGLGSPVPLNQTTKPARLDTGESEDGKMLERSSPDLKETSPSKKKVRFSDQMISNQISSRASPTSPKSDSLFYHAFQHLYDGAGTRDAVRYSQSRSDALQLQRLFMPKQHLSQLVGDREIMAEQIESSSLSTLPEGPDEAIAEARKMAVALATIEREALEQIRLSVWNLEATRQLNGGSLLEKSAINLLNQRAENDKESYILDFGGEPTADWGWAVAIEHRNANVFTAMIPTPSSPTKWKAHRGPRNHRTVPITSAWTLPFASNTFDVISARTLHTFLHTAQTPKSSPASSKPFIQDFPKSSPLSPSNASLLSACRSDDFTATLAELYRVLKPGGILSFAVMDAELINPCTTSNSPEKGSTSPTSSLVSLSASFADALRHNSYDPVATTLFLPRLRQAGFSGIRRAWTILPMTCHSFGSISDSEHSILRGRTGDVTGLTGLVGGLAWEKWMVGLAAETGREGDKVVERCGRVYAQCRGANNGIQEGMGAGWRCLKGWCQKE